MIGHYGGAIHRPLWLALIFAFMSASHISVGAQEFKLLDRTVQFHGFLSQGLIYTNTNNWLTMNTSQGSAAFTDMGLNASTQATEKFRIGAQVYDRNLGQLGQYHPSLDWAVADYRFRPWFGIRAGKVKTTIGLYNDTQDLDFIHTFALLPQSVYPTDLRDATIVHVGGDIYGTLTLKNIEWATFPIPPMQVIAATAGIAATLYLLSIWNAFFQLRRVAVRRRSAVGHSGERTAHRNIAARRGYQRQRHERISVRFCRGRGRILRKVQIRLGELQFYGEYSRGKLRIDSEYRRYLRDELIFTGRGEDIDDVRGWYVSRGLSHIQTAGNCLVLLPLFNR